MLARLMRGPEIGDGLRSGSTSSDIGAFSNDVLGRLKRESGTSFSSGVTEKAFSCGIASSDVLGDDLGRLKR